MTNKPLPTWISEGFEGFYRRFVSGEDSSFREAVRHGQKPRAMVIACADSRVDPALLFSARPGELFVVRNVAALVPPPEEDSGHHGVSAALEFGIVTLQVPQVLVVGHGLCGGIRGFMAQKAPNTRSYLGRWLELLRPLDEQFPELATADEKQVGRAAVRLSLQRLATFPFVAERLACGKLSVFGLYFELAPPTLELVETLP